MNFLKQAASKVKDGNSSDLMKQAEGFLHSSGSQGAEAPPPAPASQESPTPHAAPPAPASQDSPTPHATPAGPAAPADATATSNYTDVYGSAQTLYQGIQDKLSGKNEVDDKKLASAAEDVLKAAQTSGYLGKDNQYSDYFGKAETYLHNYGSKSASNPPVPTPGDKPAS